MLIKTRDLKQTAPPVRHSMHHHAPLGGRRMLPTAAPHPRRNYSLTLDEVCRLSELQGTPLMQSPSTEPYSRPSMALLVRPTFRSPQRRTPRARLNARRAEGLEASACGAPDAPRMVRIGLRRRARAWPRLRGAEAGGREAEHLALEGQIREVAQAARLG